jgi:hypothetical protein
MLSFEPSTEQLLWSSLRSDGWTTKQIAEESGTHQRTIQRGIQRVREWQQLQQPRRRLPEFAIRLPVVLTPRSTCPHREPIKRGQEDYCGVCHETGLDHWPELQPYPEIARDVKLPEPPEPTRTRRQKRAALNGRAYRDH